MAGRGEAVYSANSYFPESGAHLHCRAVFITSVNDKDTTGTEAANSCCAGKDEACGNEAEA